MALYDQLKSDIITALCNHDETAKNALRGLQSAIDTAVKNGTALSDELFLSVAANEVKRRKEAIALYEQSGAADKAAAEQAEIDKIAPYLPAQLSEEELKAAITATIAKTGATSVQQMGQVMGTLKAELGAAADGATLARLVKEALQ